ncbi:MAG: lysyl oxidase family protein [Actinomycetota bacterium]
MRKWVAIFMILNLAAALSTTANAQEQVDEFSLKAGQSVFWQGPESISQASFVPGLFPGDCASGVKACVDYKITVLEDAERLRVGVDSPDDGDLDNGEFLELYLFDPSGTQVDADFPLYSGEVVAEIPVTGTWIARVVATRADEATFQMRAKLEKKIPVSKGKGALLPNLRLTPPFEFTFSTPATVLGSGPAHGHIPTNGCSADEMYDYSPQRCLRFSIGPENIGKGHLELVYVPGDSVTEGTVIQRIQQADGTYKDYPAGRYEYHATHTHYHHAAFASLDLYRVTDPKSGGLELAGTGPKMGFCMGDYLIAKWHSFANDPNRGGLSSCRGILEDPSSETRIGLTRGWADIYAYFLPGNYVDFADNPDGLYVVRTKANQANSILESNKDDNFAYAYIRVMGSEIEVLERGYGMDPWDDQKVRAKDARYATAED